MKSSNELLSLPTSGPQGVDCFDELWMNNGKLSALIFTDMYDLSVRTIGLTWTGKCGGQTWAVAGLTGLDFFV